MIDQPLPVAAALAGIDDAIALTREAAGAIGDDRRSQTLTRRHLDEALELPDEPAAPTSRRRPERGRRAWASSPRTPGRCRTSRRPSRPSVATVPTSELVTWAEAARLAVSSHVRDLALLRSRRRRRPPSRRSPSWPIRRSARPATDRAAAATLVRRLQAIADQAQQLVPGDGLRLPVRPDPQALLDRVPGPGRHAGPELLRPARLRGPPRQLPRDRQGRRRPGPLVPARPRADAGRPRLRPHLVVRVDVRVPDARPRDARARPAACSTTRTGWSWPAR